MADLTAIVLTKNEEKNLPDCLSSLRGFAARVVVVDSGSDRPHRGDRPRIRRGCAHVHTFTSHARQFNWALDNAGVDTEWVLRIDADERMTDAVKAECAPILALERESGVCGITMEANFYMLGRRLRFGGAKKRKLMIFRRGCGRIEDRYIDEHTLLTAGPRRGASAPVSTTTTSNPSTILPTNSIWYASREVMDVLGGRRRR